MATQVIDEKALRPVTVGTWLRFMVGSREAIEQVAASRGALWECALSCLPELLIVECVEPPQAFGNLRWEIIDRRQGHRHRFQCLIGDAAMRFGCALRQSLVQLIGNSQRYRLAAHGCTQSLSWNSSLPFRNSTSLEV